MNERRNDLEIVMGRTIACAIQLGSISSLRCQKSRKARVRDGRRALRSDVFADDFLVCWRSAHWRSLARLRSFELRRGSHRYPGLAEPKQASPAKAGGARRDRTDDLMLAKHALSQLSYGPVLEDEGLLACRAEARVNQPADARWALARQPWLAARAKAGGPGKT